MKVGFKQYRKVLTCFRFDALHGKPQVRSPAISLNPITDFVVGSAEPELITVTSDILGKSTWGTPYSVVLTRKSCGIIRLPDSKPLTALEEDIDCSLALLQWLRWLVRGVLKAKVEFFETQLRSPAAIRFQKFPSHEETSEALFELLLHPHWRRPIDVRRRSRSNSSIRSMLYRCSTKGDSLT